MAPVVLVVVDDNRRSCVPSGAVTVASSVPGPPSRILAVQVSFTRSPLGEKVTGVVCEVVEVMGGGVVSTTTLPPRTTGPLPHGSVAVTRQA